MPQFVHADADAGGVVRPESLAICAVIEQAEIGNAPLIAKALDKLIQKRPDLTLAQMRDVLAKDCSLVAIHYATLRLDWRYKKSRYERVSKTDPT